MNFLCIAGEEYEYEYMHGTKQPVKLWYYSTVQNNVACHLQGAPRVIRWHDDIWRDYHAYE